MPPKRIVVIGTSSGGIEALSTLAAGLPKDLPAALCVVMHTAPDSPGILPAIIDRAGPLPAVAAEDGMRLDAGRIYVAPADRHLLVEPSTLRLTRGPRENRSRPAIDPLFRSAAQVFGPAAIGVVLTGNLDDGTAGLSVIKRLGGIAIVENPATAVFPSMPRHALQQVEVDYIAHLAEIPSLLIRLLEVPAYRRAEVQVPESLEIEMRIAKEENAVDAGVNRIGEPSRFACPECHGVLLQMKEAHPLRFRCHTGHAFSSASLAAALKEEAEDAVWGAVRALQESALLLDHLAGHALERGDEQAAQALAADALSAHERSNAVRKVVMARQPGNGQLHAAGEPVEDQ
jgi:two-component system chemotaxis response regulator CheB